MTRPRTPNRALRLLLTEVQWTEDQLAKRVNRVAGESGRTLALDRRSVWHWLAGRRPRSPVPELIAEVLSRELGRPISLDDLGLADRRPEPEDGAGRRQVLTSAVYSLSLLAVPSWNQAVAHEPDSELVPDSPGRLSRDHLTAAERMAEVFSAADLAFGGGHARHALAAYLSQDLLPRLRLRAPFALRRRGQSAAAQLMYLCGFMCFDDEQHGQAQAYYRAALELTAEAGDRRAYAVVLRAMSVQARALGHHRQAVHLAEAAISTDQKRAEPVRQAFLLGQMAVASAADGSKDQALSTLRQAERLLDQAGSGTDLLIGGYHPAALAHQQAAVRALLGDRRGAITDLTASVRHRPVTERRPRAITLARLAELHLGQGHLERAVTTWDAFIDDYPHLRSGRATSALRTMRQSLKPYSRNPAVKHLLTRAAREVGSLASV
ncbi:hypothetical protein ACIBG8_10040 [Nonomuraea sp. NPDC050556]|uniref:hypothetical protein n=1 Tax=Nonomuraea sp. NPDC050556 TaxID=3364369 RepID=UPI0037AAB426